MWSRLNDEVFDIPLSHKGERALADHLSLSEPQEPYTARGIWKPHHRHCDKELSPDYAGACRLDFSLPKRTGDRSSLIPARSAESPHS